jgi:hypothetical protein
MKKQLYINVKPKGIYFYLFGKYQEFSLQFFIHL